MSNSDWYARKLGASPATPPPPVQQPPAYVQQQQQQVVQPQAEEELVYAPKGATHLRVSKEGTCPECDSTNYMTPPGTQAKPRCYDCGYPLVQSGSGPAMPTADMGPAQPARQVNAGGNWNPGGFAKGVGIIGRDPSVPTG
jgi:hypothetical protein